MEKEINEKIDELFMLVDDNVNVKKIETLKNKIGEDELELINNYRNNPCIDNKEKLYKNEIINDYLVCENNLNYLIMGINSKFKRSKKCESNKW